MDKNNLIFLGTGSAFNAKLKNTSCYIKFRDSMLLIDTGGTVFHELQTNNILDGVKKLYIIITHTHPDHVGSLGDIIFYSHYIMKIKPVVYFPEANVLLNILNSMGVQNSMYFLNSNINSVIADDNAGQIKLNFMSVPHVNSIPSFGFIIEILGEKIYYSGDSNTIPQNIIEMLCEDKLHRLYQDVSGLDYEGSSHLSLKALASLVPYEFRHKVYCIHHDEYINKDMAEKQGFIFT